MQLSILNFLDVNDKNLVSIGQVIDTMKADEVAIKVGEIGVYVETEREDKSIKHSKVGEVIRFSKKDGLLSTYDDERIVIVEINKQHFSEKYIIIKDYQYKEIIRNIEGGTK